jgi:hypothetical protein
MKEINYYCDRCNEKADTLLEMNYQTDKRNEPNLYAPYGDYDTRVCEIWYVVKKLELCANCMTGLQNYLTKPHEQLYI